MKSGTVVRAVYAIAVVAILVIVALPMISALPDMKDSGLSTGTHAIYDLERMDEKSLSDNISNAIASGEGFTVEYNGNIEPVGPDSVSAVVGRILASGASVAVVKDAEGNIATQEYVIYSNAVIFGSRSGLLVPSSLIGSMKMDVSVRLFSDDGVVNHVTVPLSDGIEDEISVGFMIPIVLYNVLGAYGCNSGSVISVNYDNVIELEVRGGGDVLSYDHTLSHDGTSAILEVRGCEGNSVGVGSVGGVKLEFSYDGSTVMRMSCEGKLSDALEGSMSDGRIKVEFGGLSYLMTEDETLSLIDAIRAMEASA